MIKYNYNGEFLYIYENDFVISKRIVKNQTEFSFNLNMFKQYYITIIKEIIKSDFKPFYGSVRKNLTITKNFPKKQKSKLADNVVATIEVVLNKNIINKLIMIKELRNNISYLGLKDAKDIVDGKVNIITCRIGEFKKVLQNPITATLFEKHYIRYVNAE